MNSPHGTLPEEAFGAEVIEELAELMAEKTAVRVLEGLRATPRPFWTVESLAKLLQVSERKVRELLADGVIRSVTVGTARRIEPAAVEEYLATLRGGSTAAATREDS